MASHLQECLMKTEERLAEYSPPFTDTPAGLLANAIASIAELEAALKTSCDAHEKDVAELTWKVFQLEEAKRGD